MFCQLPSSWFLAMINFMSWIKTNDEHLIVIWFCFFRWSRRKELVCSEGRSTTKMKRMGHQNFSSLSKKQRPTCEASIDTANQSCHPVPSHPIPSDPVEMQSITSYKAESLCAAVFILRWLMGCCDGPCMNELGVVAVGPLAHSWCLCHVKMDLHAIMLAGLVLDASSVKVLCGGEELGQGIVGTGEKASERKERNIKHGSLISFLPLQNNN